MKLSLKLSCAVSLAVMISGCATTEGGKSKFLIRQVGGAGVANIQTLETDVLNTDVKTAKSESILFTQTSRASKAASLVEPMKESTLPGIGMNFKADKMTSFFP